MEFLNPYPPKPDPASTFPSSANGISIHPDTHVQVLESPLIPFFLLYPSSNLSASNANITLGIHHVSDLSSSPSPYDCRPALTNRNIT